MHMHTTGTYESCRGIRNLNISGGLLTIATCHLSAMVTSLLATYAAKKSIVLLVGGSRAQQAVANTPSSKKPSSQKHASRYYANFYSKVVTTVYEKNIFGKLACECF